MNDLDIRKLLRSPTPDTVAKLQSALTANPEKAVMTFRAQSIWRRAKRLANPALPGLESQELASADRGYSSPVLPVEHLLYSLASCVAESIVYQAAVQRIRLEVVEVSIESVQDIRGWLGMSNRLRSGLSNLRVAVRLTGNAVSRKLREIVLLAQYHSPVFETLVNGALIDLAIDSQRVHG